MLLRNLPPQHPIYGLSHSNLEPVLTRTNWRKKAVVRVSRHQPEGCWMILWVQEMGLGDSLTYAIQNTGTCPDIASYEAKLATLEAALTYINGENPSDSLAINTRLAVREEWPPESLPRSNVSSMP